MEARSHDPGEDRQSLATRTEGALMLAGAVLTMVTVALPPAAQRSDAVILALGALIGAAGLALLAMRRAPYAVLGAGAALATAVITAATYEAGLAGTGAESNPIVYLWVCLFSFYFFSRRHALAQLAFAGACFGALLIADAPAETVVTRWLTAMTTLLVAGLLIAMLRDRLEGAVAEMSRRATRDPLTGALNRRGLEGRFQQELARSMRDRAPFSVAALDVDQLKTVNDSLGHPAGDHLLRSVSEALEAETRGIDTIARVGGDEFAILMPGVSREEATLAAERLRRAIAAKVVTGEEPVRVTLGVATAPPESAVSFELLWSTADSAMYGAKRGGGNSVGVAAVGPPEEVPVATGDAD